MVQNAEKLALATHYRKRGFSYSEIAKICGVSKATVSNWLSKKPFSKKVKADNIKKAAKENVIRLSLLNKARTTERKKRYQEAQQVAHTEYKHYRHNPLFIAGLMLYLASGDKADTARIRLSSKDPSQHRLFISFLSEFCGVQRTDIKCWLLLSSVVSHETAVSNWSRLTKLPKAQFGKSQYVSQNTKTALQYGTGNTIIASTVLKHKLNRWVELALKEL